VTLLISDFVNQRHLQLASLYWHGLCWQVGLRGVWLRLEQVSGDFAVIEVRTV